ncbi:MAG: hypothetical protein H6581_02960 [Bacteroidia bacterium]|nr:hypothetical protein [Bacteroidia bacterium]
MKKQSEISAPKISLPTGGGALRGMQESFTPNAFTGTFSYSIPLPAPSGRGFAPSLSVDYASGGGHGIFGLGFQLPLLSVSRKTTRGIPRYNDEDVFLLSGGALTPALIPTSSGWEKDLQSATLDGSAYQVQAYRPRTEGTFDRIEKWTEQATGLAFWKIITAANETHYLGKTSAGRIADPQNPARIFEWLIEGSTDAKGNQIRYNYLTDPLGQPGTPSEANRNVLSNRYPDSVQFGNYYSSQEPGQQRFAFQIKFGYGPFDPQNPTAAITPVLRPDPYSVYRPGFEVRTRLLCQNVRVFHQFEGEFSGESFLTTVLDFQYQTTPYGGNSLLQRVVETGYRRDEAGNYTSRALPPVDLTYQEFDPLGQEFRKLEVLGGANLPGNLSRDGFLPVDLKGEGLPGFLHSNAEVTQYLEPLGQGRYGRSRALDEFPLQGNLQDKKVMLTSLEGNYVMDLVVGFPPAAGYYREGEEGQWQNFRQMESLPIDYFNHHRQLLDITGDGRADLMLFEPESLKYYPSYGTLGFGRPENRLKPPGFPLVESSSQTELLTFADMFGDGMTHYVRITNGRVECWPGLGYGHFGEKVVLENAPQFGEELDLKRLQLADLDGSGTTDICYAGPDYLLIWFNQSGNRFSEPLRLPLDTAWDNLAEINFADVNGTGTASLILSRQIPAPEHHYYDFSGGKKPYLLTGMKNNMGAETRVNYASSVQFYLDDKQQGRPWLTRLPFPVQVMESAEILDHTTGYASFSRYRYHDGYFDPVEREFRGFGFVESWDSDHFEKFRPGTQLPPDLVKALDQALFVPPVYTKTWFHTGAALRGELVAAQYAREFWSGDAQAWPDLPLSTFGPEIDLQDALTLQQARAATAGHTLRSEVYGLDHHQNPQLTDLPYTVAQSTVHIRQVQPREEQRYAVFLPLQQESLSYEYDRNPADPRITHTFDLETDEYGTVRKSCAVSYGRRNGADIIYPEQQELKVLVSENDVINTVNRDENDPAQFWQLLAVQNGSRTLHALEVAAPAAGYFTFAQIAEAVEQSSRQLLTSTRSYFWSADLTQPLDYGQISLPGLLHHTETAALSEADVTSIYGDKVDNDMLQCEAGYLLQDGYWWKFGLTQHYYSDPSLFYQPSRTDNAYALSKGCLQEPDRPAGGGLDPVVTLEYDPYALLITEENHWYSPSEALVTGITYDYQTLEPAQIMDFNGNLSEVLFDPLGMVVATSIHGVTGGQPAGDLPLSQYVPVQNPSFEDVLQNPEAYLQGASSFYYYDLSTWMNPDNPGPVCAIQLQRTRHVHEPQAMALPDGDELIRQGIVYNSGSGQILQTKTLTNPGPVALQEINGEWVLPQVEAIPATQPAQRWSVTGRTVMNNKGQVAQTWPAFYSHTPYFEDQQTLIDQGLTPPPVITHYDPMGRVIRIDDSKGFFSKVIYSPWESWHYDANDTVCDSVYYQDFMKNYPASPTQAQELEKAALDKAAVFNNTPVGEVQDNLGRVIYTLEDNGPPLDPASTERILTTQHVLDIQGREITLVDPRLYRENLLNGTDLANFRHLYDMNGGELYTFSADAGESWILENIFNHPVRSFNSRNFVVANRYDNLQRHLSSTVLGGDGQEPLNNVVELNIYGEGQENASANNLLGEIWQSFDQAGLVVTPLYDLTGNSLAQTRYIRSDGPAEANWTEAAQAAILQEEAYASGQYYNAIGHVLVEELPDQSKIHHRYHRSGLPRRTWAEVPGEGENAPVEVLIEGGAEYSPDGLLLSTLLGNGVRVSHTLEASTRHLLRIKSTRKADAEGGTPELLQDLNYTYDPVGNISSIFDGYWNSVYNRNQAINPVSAYTYDPLYRLIEATGRSHANLQDGRTGNFSDLQNLENYTRSYRYDGGGNLVTRRHVAASGRFTQLNTIARDSNRIQDLKLGSGSKKTPAGPGFTYDASGNMQQLAPDGKSSLQWNYRDELSSVLIIDRNQKQGPKQMDDGEYYLYDAHGNRVKKVSTRMQQGGKAAEMEEKIYLGAWQSKRITIVPVNDGKINPDGGKIQLERHTVTASGGSQTEARIHYSLTESQPRGNGKIQTPYTVYSLGTDQGSVSLQLDAAASILSYEEYFPYGGTSFFLTQKGVEANLKEYRYLGKEKDALTGLYYYGARYYATWTCRWMNPDPAGTVDGPNLYAYVQGNPVSWKDRDGQAKRKNGSPKYVTKSNGTSGGSPRVMPTNFKAGVVKPRKSGLLGGRLRKLTAAEWRSPTQSTYSSVKINGKFWKSFTNGAPKNSSIVFPYSVGLYSHGPNQEIKRNPHSEDWLTAELETVDWNQFPIPADQVAGKNLISISINNSTCLNCAHTLVNAYTELKKTIPGLEMRVKYLNPYKTGLLRNKLTISKGNNVVEINKILTDAGIHVRFFPINSWALRYGRSLKVRILKLKLARAALNSHSFRQFGTTYTLKGVIDDMEKKRQLIGQEIIRTLKYDPSQTYRQLGWNRKK